MKTTARILVGSIAVAIGLPAANTPAGPTSSTMHLMLAAAGASQVAGPATSYKSKREQADDLLRRARQLKAQADFDAAESLVDRTEALGVDYGFTLIGNTPKKVRREIQKARDAANKSPGLPSQLFSPSLFGKSKQKPPTNPFAGRGPNNASNTNRAVNSLTDRKTVAESFLRSGRNALAAGNLTEASHWYRMAAKEPATFSPMEYSPAKLAVDIRAAGGAAVAPAVASHPSNMAAPPRSVPSLPPYGFATAQAPFRSNGAMTPPAGQPSGLPPAFATETPGPAAGVASISDAGGSSYLRDARRALAEGDLDRADYLVGQAKAHRGIYGPLDDTPEKVEAAIDGYEALKILPKGTNSYRRAYANFLMEQARALTRHQDYDRAEQLAQDAARQRVIYGAFEMKPEELLARITAKRRQTARAATQPGPGSPAERTAFPMPSQTAIRKAANLTRQARQALNRGQLEMAEGLARQAERMQVPNSAFGPGVDRPGLVLMDIDRANRQNPSRVVPAGGQRVVPATGPQTAGHTASRALYDPANDPTRNRQAFYQQRNDAAAGVPTAAPPMQFVPGKAGPTPAPPSPSPVTGNAGPGTGRGMVLFQQGLESLKAYRKEQAYQYFQQAAAYMNTLDPNTQQSLRTYLQMLAPRDLSRSPGASPGPLAGGALSTPDMLARQISTDVAQQEIQATRMRATDPKGSLSLLEETRKKVETANLDPVPRQQLLRRLDRAIQQTGQYIQQNRPAIELAEYNEQVHSDVERERRVVVEIQENLALLVDEFDRLMDEGRYLEAEVVAKRAAEIAPDDTIVQQLKWMAKFVSQYEYQMSLREDKERAYVIAMGRSQEASIPFDPDEPYLLPDSKTWGDLIRRRARFGDNPLRRTPEELEIERKLRTPVSVRFNGEPLSNVLDYLETAANVNIYLDPLALQELGIDSSSPVTMDLQNEIQLKSVLNLILPHLHLGYVVKDEVLKITSEQQCEGDVKVRTYNVADLVMPIPNFRPGPMGLEAAYNHALGNISSYRGGGFGASSAPLSVLATKDGSGGTAAINPGLLAQVSRPGQGGMPQSVPIGAGPGGLGGGSQADFDPLIELIQTTIRPDSWDTIGGPGSIAPFETNLSLVVSQTQEIHEEIVDLLEQLRRLQDLQVTIEVRFITLNDNFFERIGVDFDFDIDDDIDRPFMVFGRPIPGDDGDPLTGTEPGRNTLDVDWDPGKSVVVGMQQPGVFSADLDIPFTQGSFGLAVPQFGGFDAAAGAQLGFAILSDIEAFFFINAAQGDRRSNVMQSPKVTLFNGQQAYISDTSQSPFVISVVPVVGEFAAAQQPVIVILSEGTMMTVHAVVSPDKRYVRLTVVPFFSRIGEVNTFQFTGSETSTTDVSAQGIQDDPTDASGSSASSSRTRSGTTVQLPTFSFVTVTTTVSVPDGGTVLLGGIKRLSEGRNEFGVPMLNKIPYVNRLFKNVGIGRETQSLMMMVTPRIIIQEEEEARVMGVPST